MAVVTSLNVISASANADVIAGRSLAICGIKAVETAGATAEVKLRDAVVGGKVLWHSKLAANGVDFNHVGLKGVADLYLEIVSGAATVYLYSE